MDRPAETEVSDREEKKRTGIQTVDYNTTAYIYYVICPIVFTISLDMFSFGFSFSKDFKLG